MKWIIVGMCLFVCVGAGADGVTTNVWTNAEGGNINVIENWQDGAMPCSTNVVDFSQLGSGKVIENKKVDAADGTTYSAAGILFAGTPAEDLNWTHNGGTLNAYASTLGYFPICVQGGTLHWNTGLVPQGGTVFRKTGDGTLMAQAFKTTESTGTTLEIESGHVEPEAFSAFWATHIRVKEGGTFSLKQDEGNTYVGSFETETSDSLNLNGNSISFGGSGDWILSGAITGPGKVQSVAGANLAVTNVSTDITYVAREGNLRFDGAEIGLKGMIACWRFNDAENPGRDSSTFANDLFASNDVEIVEDEIRGKVARFNGSGAALHGMGSDGSIKSLPSGKHPYTYAYWLKRDTVRNVTDNAALFFWGMLPVVGDKIMINRIGMDHDYDSQLCLGHNGSACGWPKGEKIRSGAWIHVAVTFDGKTMRTYLDGNASSSMDYPNTDLPAKNFSIGRPWSTSASWFIGWMDDAMMFDRALSPAEVTRLANDEASQKLTPLELPDGAKLSTTLNGEIYLAGTQSVATVGGNSIRGGVRMIRPGQLTLTGDAAGSVVGYTADIAGPVDVVKDGADTTVVMHGPISTTGKVRVKAGTLALSREGTDGSALFARYDFEDAANLGRDSSGKGRNLANDKGVAQVEDETRGKVAQFTASSKQTLSGTFATGEMSGNSDYTFSIWAKASSNCPESGSFVSFGIGNSDFKQVQFRYQNLPNKTLVLAHWGGALDFSGIPGPSDPTAWHHYVAVRKGNDFCVYCDGVQKTKQINSKALDFTVDKNVYVGSHFASNDARFFDGLIDDVRIYRVGLDSEDVTRLYNGEEPLLTGQQEDNLIAEPADRLPKPVLHYAFEDASNLGKDSSATGCNLEAGGSGSLSQGDSILPGKALQFDVNALSYLQSGDVFPSVIPQGESPFTVSFWVQTTELDTQNSEHYPTFVSWGDPDAKTIGFMFSYYYNLPWRWRLYVGGTNAQDLNSNKTVLGLQTGSEAGRWHHVVTTYEKDVGLNTYVDGMRNGELSKAASNVVPKSEAKRFYLGLKPTELGCRFVGKLDEVKIYNVALNEEQVRLAMRAEMNPGSAVLPKSAEVTVDAGATLETRGGVNEVAALAGAGTVDVGVSSRFGAADYTDFTGTITGKGALRVTGTVVPSGVTVESNVEVGDLELKLSDAGRKTPFVTTTGNVLVAATGTCAITGWQQAKQLGGKEWVIAKGAAVTLPTDFSGWTLTPEPDFGYRFFVRDDTVCLRIKASGMMILIR